MAPHHPEVRPGPQGYKEEPAPVAGDPAHHPQHPQQAAPPTGLQHPRPSSIVQQQQQHHPGSPHQPSQPQHPGAYASPHAPGHGLQHQSPYPPGPAPNGQPHPSEVAGYYNHPSPYHTPTSGQYSSSEAPELMAAAHMQQRPYPPIYHTPQSNSPASVASPQSHDQHGRSMYGQPPSQMPQGMYGYPQYPPMNQVHPSPYQQHPGPQPQHQNMSTQPLLMSHQPNPQQMQHPQSQGQAPGMTNSPRPKLEPSTMQRPLDSAGLQQRPQPAPIGANGVPGPPTNGHPNNGLGTPGSGVNSNAAPGPIPATTPLVVRQDNNGVQWIAFEYSRDRVKMEYTIRCDVESVNVEALPGDFKNENCVYPRACCNKDQYRGNRLVYETECNTVGWALAELNPPLRGKRGLIQRAVDSWRNSNSDPKLRSRRVRRMAKVNNRKHIAQTPNHLAGPGGPGAPPGVPGPNPMAAPLQRPQPSAMGMGGGPQLHHHHAHPDGSAAPGADDVSGTSSNTDIRPSHVFHGSYPSYPPHPTPLSNSIPSSLHSHDLESSLGSSHRNTSATSATSTTPTLKRPFPSPTESPTTTASTLYGSLPESKRRKFILVDDTLRGTRVRVRVTLDQVEMKEMPDSYRKSNSVYPRSYFPMQMQEDEEVGGKGRMGGGRFIEEGESDDDEGGSERATAGRTLVAVPMLMGEGGGGGERETEEVQVAVPRITRGKRKRECVLNELGYRMSWSQSRVFAGRIMFLQKSLDAYRNKMRSTMLATSTGLDSQRAETVAPHFETRVGKRRWLERARKSAGAPGAVGSKKERAADTD